MFPVLFLPHGGGPLPLLGDHRHQTLIEFLTKLSVHLPKPKAIVVISAHWEQTQATITSSQQPELIYDYYGFAEQAYQIKYPVLGDYPLATKLATLLQDTNIPVALDSNRGLDHGVYVPLKLVYPKAEIPCLQLSLMDSLDAKSHIELGKALASLREQKVLIIGSGFSFHNMKELRGTKPQDDKNLAFEAWLQQSLTSSTISPDKRIGRLVDWQQAPFAEYCHPRAEHLLPLHVCLGAANGQAAKQIFSDKVLGKIVSGYMW